MPALAGTGLGQIQEPEIHSESPMWMAGTHVPEPLLAASWGVQ